MGDMLEPETEMLGEVAGELVENCKTERIMSDWGTNLSSVKLGVLFLGFLFDFDGWADWKSVDNSQVGSDGWDWTDMIDSS